MTGILINDGNIFADIKYQDVIDDDEFAERLRLGRFRSHNRTILPFRVGSESGNEKIPCDDDPYHPRVDEVECGEREQCGGGEDLIGKWVEEFSPPGNIPVLPCNPPVVPV